MELVCPAGNLPSLKAAVDAGADTVYIGFQDETNARHFAGLNFNQRQLQQALQYIHQKGKKIYLALNTYANDAHWSKWQRAVDQAADLGFDALIAADIGVLDYASQKYPQLRLHLSVQASATNYEALRFYREQFGIERAVLPRVLSLAQVEQLAQHSPVDLEVFGFGSLCIMAEGRCLLSSYAAGESPNTHGCCSPASQVEYQQTAQGMQTRLGGILIDQFGAQEQAGYPTICKGRYQALDKVYYALEEPTSLNTLDILPQLKRIGIAAIKIEGRQRSPAYIKQVAHIWRQAIDACLRDPEAFQAKPEWMQGLSAVSEGQQTTLGAYHRIWQ